MWANRRRFRRVMARSRCWCETEGITIYAKIVNVSEGGVFIRTFAPLTMGSTAKLRFNVDGLREVVTEAVVVWIRPTTDSPTISPGMGLRFIGATAETVEAIRAYVDSTQTEGEGGNA